jgi:ABC-type nitrate/sulfonate/bicarbonate transport system permease component
MSNHPEIGAPAPISAVAATTAITPGARKGTRWLSRDNRGTIGVIVAFGAIWQISSYFVPTYLFPSPVETLARAQVLLTDPVSYATILVTVSRIFIGFIVSSMFGIVLGMAMALVPAAYTVLRPFIALTMGIPSLTWVLFGILWFQSMDARVWFFMFVIVFPVTALSTYDGVRAIPHDLYQMSRSFRPSTYRHFKALVVPGSMPFIFSGLRVSLSFAGRIAVFAEALSAATGIGAKMFHANQVFDTPSLLVWTGVLIVILAVLDRFLDMVERRWFHWRRSIVE